MSKRTCSIGGCDWKPDGTQRSRRGLCPRHYTEWRIQGTRCKEPECAKPANARRGWCWGHYERWRKSGDPQSPVLWHEGETAQDRIFKKVVLVAGCWEWTGHIDSNGYGKASRGWAHRLSYEAFVAPIPEGLEIDHLCRNRRCVNPEHLETVSRAENLRRSPLVGKNSHPQPQCKRGHSRDPENLYYRPNGSRECRLCARLRASGATG